MPISEALPQACVNRTGERARGGRVCWIDTSPWFGLAVLRRRGNVWKVSEMASFSSSLKRLLVVGYLACCVFSVGCSAARHPPHNDRKISQDTGKHKNKRQCTARVTTQAPPPVHGRPGRCVGLNTSEWPPAKYILGIASLPPIPDGPEPGPSPGPPTPIFPTIGKTSATFSNHWKTGFRRPPSPGWSSPRAWAFPRTSHAVGRALRARRTPGRRIPENGVHGVPALPERCSDRGISAGTAASSFLGV